MSLRAEGFAESLLRCLACTVIGKWRDRAVFRNGQPVRIAVNRAAGGKENQMRFWLTLHQFKQAQGQGKVAQLQARMSCR